MTLCHLLTENGLEPSRKKVAIFLWILSHHTKNRRTILQFWRSGETISRHFHTVLIAVLRLNKYLWYHPQPIPANESDARWKWFERTMAVDPIEAQYTAWEQANLHNIPPDEYIRTLESTNQWTQMRDNLATQMYNDWLAHHGGGQ
ncbi:hypothetical protein RHMOL_Rhmol10G0075400 [Rhododendron molle]|uniref:Uncharacterized protein n=1 Tax=Rhododendron molle TaxID=49168 RepID=A0ACC0LZT2_RHOML|nr:hypothetical protein RHMOL_Rhmol10G0075400 [Rhododendron molle]